VHLAGQERRDRRSYVWGQKREDLQLILFSALLLIIVVGGTVWIMGSLGARMAMPPRP